MPRITVVFGLLLCGLSVLVAAILVYRNEFKIGTWLIPTGVGLPLIVLGAMAAKNAASKKHAMHAAVTLALVGGLVALIQGVSQVVRLLLQGKEILPLAAGMIWAMTILCFVFVGLCVQSFIAARKAREK
jgi:uncharacterized membrane protein